MKASEIMELMQRMINLHGDLEVYPEEGVGFFTHTYPMKHIGIGERDVSYLNRGKTKKVFVIHTGVGA